MLLIRLCHHTNIWKPVSATEFVFFCKKVIARFYLTILTLFLTISRWESQKSEIFKFFIQCRKWASIKINDIKKYNKKC